MLCVNVTRNVVKKPKRTCCVRVVFTTMKPIKSVTMKHTMESRADVSRAKTMRLIILSQLRGEAWNRGGYCRQYACMLLHSNASIGVRNRHCGFSFRLRAQAC